MITQLLLKSEEASHLAGETNYKYIVLTGSIVRNCKVDLQAKIKPLGHDDLSSDQQTKF